MKFGNIGIFVLLLSLFSCQSGTSEEGGSQKEFITDSAPEADSLADPIMISDSTRIVLEKYFSEAIIIETQNYLREYHLASTDTAIEKVYNSGIALVENYADAFKNPQTEYLKNITTDEAWEIFPVYEDLNKLNGKVGPIYFTCVAECSMLDFCFDLNLLFEKAKTTKGNADDDLFDILAFVEMRYGYAGYNHFKVWTKQYWDYGGANLLGNGKMLDVARRVQKFEQTHTLFNAQIALVREDIVEELSWGHSYQFSVEEVLAEYNKIFKLNFFNEEELKGIRAHYDKLKSEPGEFQFDCENGNCKFG